MHLNLFSHKITLCFPNNFPLHLPIENWALRFTFFRNITLFLCSDYGSAPFTLNSSTHVTRSKFLCKVMETGVEKKDQITLSRQIKTFQTLIISSNCIAMHKLGKAWLLRDKSFKSCHLPSIYVPTWLAWRDLWNATSGYLLCKERNENVCVKLCLLQRMNILQLLWK